MPIAPEVGLALACCYAWRMALMTLSNIQLAYGHVALLDRAHFALEAGERVGLVGRNGTGKSSLLKILAGLELPDDGLVQRQQDLRCAYVAQEPVFEPGHTVFESVSAGLQQVRALREAYERTHDMKALDTLQSQIEAAGGWQWEQRVGEALQRLGLDGEVLTETLSGGQRKRVALAQALVATPDVLLLDEPTNHLDMEAMDWLADLLKAFQGAVVVISHDRFFLDAVCTRIVELDRGHLGSYEGHFSAYEALKEAQLEQEAVVQAKADKLLAQEEVWIRKGVEARRTRAQARIERLKMLRQQRQQRRDVVGQARVEIQSGQLGGKLVAELTGVSHWFEATGGSEAANPTSNRKTVVRNLTTTVVRGDKVGLIGPNGAGKTTLLRLILGQLQPCEGQVRTGSRLEVAYFDQMRAQLDLDATLEDVISPGSEWIELGTRKTHVKSYLSDFLFSPARAQSPVRSLSGGERNRLLLARLFARPANVLVLDEPTNDLDIDTLELLEQRLATFDGTVFLVSHDRRFLDQVVTSTLVYEGLGEWREYEGGVEDWITQSKRLHGTAPVWHVREAAQTTNRTQTTTANGQSAGFAPAHNAATTPPTKRKLSYKEQRELEALPGRIDALEAEQRDIDAALADGHLYANDHQKAAALTSRRDAIEQELMAALERWEALGT
jgi:ABC transport system ATP-binding/permease protein